MEWPPSCKEIMLPLAKTGHTDTRGIRVRVRVSRKHETLDPLSDSTLAVHIFRLESADCQCHCCSVSADKHEQSFI